MLSIVERYELWRSVGDMDLNVQLLFMLLLLQLLL